MIGFSDNNAKIDIVMNMLKKENIPCKKYILLEQAIDDLIDKKISCLVGGNDISTAEFLKQIISKTKPQNRLYSYSILKKGDEEYIFADTAVNVGLDKTKKQELSDLLKKEFNENPVELSYITNDQTMQVDAALDIEISHKKGYFIERPYRIFIFPDLNSANISYKLIQKLGKFHHIGPIILGSEYNISDLSRGADVDEIYQTAKYLYKRTK